MNDIFNENVSLKTETPAFAKHVLPAVPTSDVYLEDCVKALKRYADNHFDLAIVDPPYGINMGFDGWDKKAKSKINKEREKAWDNETPKKEYWDELFRVSKNQIIWGGNYFLEYLKSTSCFLSWDKMNGTNNMADFELAWTSFDTACRRFQMHHFSQGYEDKIHPTQKPTKLYDWILSKYAKPNDLILDTHLGSGSSRIAAYKGGFNFVGFELDTEYFEKGNKRFEEFKSQLKLF